VQRFLEQRHVDLIAHVWGEVPYGPHLSAAAKWLVLAWVIDDHFDDLWVHEPATEAQGVVSALTGILAGTAGSPASSVSDRRGLRGPLGRDPRADQPRVAGTVRPLLQAVPRSLAAQSHRVRAQGESPAPGGIPAPAGHRRSRPDQPGQHPTTRSTNVTVPLGLLLHQSAGRGGRKVGDVLLASWTRAGGPLQRISRGRSGGAWFRAVLRLRWVGRRRR
jgi:hypothetical protein